LHTLGSSVVVVVCAVVVCGVVVVDAMHSSMLYLLVQPSVCGSK
jgi:hypothetical protein